jgi:myo-inositol 2-dehydrogenase / D-chiro-inositol 1-dehydrogenase
MAALKVGLIGCGYIGRFVHLDILKRLPETDLVALAEPDTERLNEAARRAPQAATFADYHELVKMSEVDAVVICLPNALHADAAVAALEHGKHIYLEKPLATSRPDAHRVLEVWRRAGVVGMIGYNFRFHALYQTVRRHIQAGRLGELIAVRSVFAASGKSVPSWKQTRRDGGGVLLDLASHHLDLIHFLFGQGVKEVFTCLRSQRSEGDSAAMQLRLADGLLVQSFFSLSAVDEDRFEIYGRRGKLMIDRYLSWDIDLTEPAIDFSRLKQMARGLQILIGNRHARDKITAPRREASYRAALAHFVAAARDAQLAYPDLWDGYRSLAIIEAAEESARTGKMVSIPDFSDEMFVGLSDPCRETKRRGKDEGLDHT